MSPYSQSYPGGVERHVEALHAELVRAGHEARVLAPWDPDDRLAQLAHGGSRPRSEPPPEHLVPLGRTLAWPINGSAANLAFSPSAYARLSNELRTGGYDVVHVHEPHAPVVSWSAAERPRAPLVATFHCYSSSALSNGIAKLGGARRVYLKPRVRIAVSEAARWTCERFYGGGPYRIIPNGVDLGAAVGGPKPGSEDLRILYVGRAEERKGLPVLLRAFEALRAAGVPARLALAGVSPEAVEPLLVDPEGVDVLGGVTEAEKWRLLHEADLLCAPALGGESFGMVLTEAFAAGTPVVASDVAGYRQVVRHGTDGLLVPPRRADELARALRALHEDPTRRRAMGCAARAGAERFAWPTVAGQVVEAYEDALAMGEPAGRVARLAVRAGVAPADGPPYRRPPRRLPPLDEPDPEARRRRASRVARTAGAAAGVATAAGLVGLAVARIGIDAIAGALLGAAPVWVLIAFGLMCLSLLARAEAWHAILRAALPAVPVGRGDVARATMIGVLMSATLPARLGEPARALVVARALGRVRERLGVVLGTVVSQTLLNAAALCTLGAVMVATVGLFRGGEGRLVALTVLPLAGGLALLLAPAVMGGRSSRLHAATAAVRRGLAEVRSGLDVFRRPREGAWAAVAQFGAWGVQWLSCWALLVALGLDERAGAAAAAAVLFAVNVTAILPVTPANVGVYQAACVAVLSAYGVGATEALAYGIILQGLEMATALALGGPALLREGMSWREMRARALHATPVPELGAAARAHPAEA